MRCRPWRWLWGLVPLAAIAALVLIVERPRIEADLTNRTQAALEADKLGWAVPSFEGRDGTIRGDVDDPSEQEQAADIVRNVVGVRVVEDLGGLLPSAYRWSARMEEGRIKLRGTVASESDRRTVVGLASASFPGIKVDNRLEIARDGTQPDVWIAGIGFGLKQLGNLRNGFVMLNENALTVRGEAIDLAAYRAVKAALQNDLPDGIVLAKEDVIAPTVSPFNWSAELSDNQLQMEGHVPETGVQQQLMTAAKKRFDRAVLLDRTEIARGAPGGFARAAETAMGELGQLISGRVAIRDDLLTVSGLAQSREKADAVIARLRTALPRNFRFEERIDIAQARVERISPYPFEIELVNGDLVLSGRVPDEAARNRLLDMAQRRNSDARIVDELQLGAGAPDAGRWFAAVEFALDQLGGLSSGRASFSDLALSISGKARGLQDYAAIEAALRNRLPAGVRIASSAIEQPVVSPFAWSAAWRDGAIELDGYVPDERAKSALRDYLERRQQGVPIIDRTVVAAGAPGRSATWSKTAETGLRALSLLGGGRAEMIDNRLRVEGIASDAGLPDRIARLVRTGLPSGFSGSSDVSFERPDEPDLTWRLVVRSDGLEMSGEVPDEATRKALLELARREFRGRAVVDRMRVVAGVSDRWNAVALTGMRLVGRLGEGEATLLGQVLTVRGRTTNQDIADVVRQAFAGGGLPGGYSGVDRVSVVPALPVLSPYRWQAAIEGGELVLSGAVPDQATRETVLRAAKDRFPNLRVVDELQLALGLPEDRDGWLRTLQSGLELLAAEGNGRAELVDRELTIFAETVDPNWRNGRTAASLRRDLPRGFSGVADLAYQAPPQVDWDARLENGELVLSGEVPEAAAQTLLGAARRNHPGVRVIDDMRRVSLAPDGWLAATQSALQSLAGLNQGTATLRDKTLRLTGLVANESGKQQATRNLARGLPSGYVSEPEIEVRPELQVIAPYAWGAYFGGRRMSLSGFVPDADTKREIEEQAARLFPNARVSSSLAIGGGAPDRFAEAAVLALEQLALLRSGTVTFSDLSARIRGAAESEDVRNDVRDVFERGLPGRFRGVEEIDVDRRTASPTTDRSPGSSPSGAGVIAANPVQPGQVDTGSARTGAGENATPLRNRYRVARNLPQVNVEEELASTRPVDPDVCQVLLDSILSRGEIRFRTSSARLEPDSFATLVRLTHVAGRCPDAGIEIAGHTDSDGGDAFNQKLSERRAAAVVSYLVNSGLDRQRLKSTGFGEQRPVAPNDSAENKARNRRIEFEVLVR